ncbi:lysosomal thioesterase PPT2 homolog [Cimex lectularius]|uniref:palmitoyl-CoA hydrolase n=1 Tax=Cimex lectularius TaxID=79782 RepID=A0A8I6RLZ5_CIMLE|nr:lysosomal thioesterase PPT2 homolog [Cimex lectularius]
MSFNTFIRLNLLFSLYAICAWSYKPVVIIHGVLTGNITMLPLAERIKELHPGTEIFATDRFGGWSSLRPMWHQVMEIGADINKFMSSHPEGIHIIGYSQGGLLARAILEFYSNHNVNTFVSLSSPQCGQYGTQFLHLFFPTLACETAFELFYSMVGQKTSVGNYWNDPYHQKLFLKYSVFLPYINNIISSDESCNFKAGLTKLKRMVLIGGPDDGVITPWQSSHFGCFDGNETTVKEMRDQDFYQNDSFGLKTLDKKKRLFIHSLSGNSHFEWHTNLTVIDKYIIPYLD